VMLGAVVFGHKGMQVAISAIGELVAQAGKPRWPWTAPAENPELSAALTTQAETALTKAFAITEKLQRRDRVAEVNQHRASDHREGRRAAAYPRFGAVHPR
jgi:polyribonucleotide nucleotidyltransferase